MDRKNDITAGLLQTAAAETENRGVSGLTVNVACRMDVAAPWGVSFGPYEENRFRLVTSGKCWIESEACDAPEQLVAGDIAFVAAGIGHSLGHSPGTERIQLDSVLRRAARSSGKVKLGGRGARTTIICGSFPPDQEISSKVMAGNMFTIRRTCHKSAAWLQLVGLIDRELESGGAGSIGLASRLAGVLLTCLVQGGEGRASKPVGRIADALSRLHGNPFHDWKVDELAGSLGMSRSGFTGRFRDLVGESPMRYLQRCRLEHAADYLENGDAGLSEIAARTGYHSDVALSKAFKKRFGVSPGGFRKAARISGQRPGVLA